MPQFSTPDNLMPDPLFVFLSPIWGRRYILDFLDITLPSWLAAGNIPGLAEQGAVTFFILTSLADEGFLRRHSTFKRLAACANVRVISIDDILDYCKEVWDGNAVHALNLAYIRGVQCAPLAPDRCAFFLMNGDKVFSKGSFQSVARRLREGARVVYHGNYRVESDILEHLKGKVIDGVLEISPRDLLRSASEYTHAISRSYFWAESQTASSAANQFYWRVGDEGYIGHFFLPHPLCVWPEHQFQTWNGFADFALVPSAVRDSAKRSFIDSSDDLACIEYANPGYEREFVLFGRKYEVGWMADELRRWTTSEHRDAAVVSLRYIFNEPSASRWASVENEASAVIAELLEKLACYPPVSPLGHGYWGANSELFVAYEKYRRNVRAIGGMRSRLEYAGVRLAWEFTKVRYGRNRLFRRRAFVGVVFAVALALACLLGFIVGTLA